MRIVSLWLLLFTCQLCCAQDNGFRFGEVTDQDLKPALYEKDTAATAVILREFGEAYIDNYHDNNLLFEYHVVIKILKQQGLHYADVEIPLRKHEGRFESIREVKASSFNLENGSKWETKMDVKNVFTENISKYWDQKKFAIPNVRVGSVIEIKYTLESPFIYNFRTWEFQTDIPKISSEYWATIPGNYKYNMRLNGYFPLERNETEVIRDCFTPGHGQKADCARYKWGMSDIPAFIEEDYMTAKTNFLSAIHFELLQVDRFDGTKNKITTEWKEVEAELRQDNRFGVQIRRGDDIVGKQITDIVVSETDPLQRARKIYDFIKYWYQWNEVYGIFSEFGIKKAFDKKTGNVGDINLSLVAALKYAKLDVEPMILSTRSNGLPTDLFPVISDFNYVIAKLNINGKTYLLDATDDFLPFGLLPERCLNGQGRAFGEKESYWYPLAAEEKGKTIHELYLVLQENGTFKGTIQTTYFGYDAVDERKIIAGYASPEEYIRHLDDVHKTFEIGKGVVSNTEELSSPLSVKLEVTIDGDGAAQHILFNPYLLDRWKKNPFRSNERLYPVDFGVPKQEILLLNLDYPATFEVAEIPPKVGLALPNGGGRYIVDVKNEGNKLSVNSSLLIAKPIFTSEEYHYLKELFNHVVATQQNDLLISKRK